MFFLDLAVGTIICDHSYPIGPPSDNVILTLEHMQKRRGVYSERDWRKPKCKSARVRGMLLAKSEEELEAVKVRNWVASACS